MKLPIMLIIVLFLVPFAIAELRVGFYRSTCPKAESIVQQLVQKRFNRDKSITAALLRLHFHDCFVTGCDASILIDSTPTSSSEKEASANVDIRGNDLIDELKQSIETECPSTVSCADIITLATRDAVALSGGPKYQVPTGRRDGLISKSTQVHLPGPNTSISNSSNIFAMKGLNTQEMVSLLGAHTVGHSHCEFFRERLLGKRDPAMDPALGAQLRKICDSTERGEQSVFLDMETPFVVDNLFYRQILRNRGVLQIDQELALDSSTRGFVSAFAADAERFRNSFADAMVKMGMIEVLLGNQGEIRKNCRVFNKRN